ncbi:hypothetical protein BJF87_21510 [Gordonia sp. CNJ-863]|uniref:hypothetical protein n=1 Tax=Gordonia sp. CNJ-863 TaxID=1904963 RepID=UPI00095DA8E1|nr:hypothetical protein [Gordonia sp. CNJ-863]OLT47796.1 hypothetical protein BJF87_21510 [Gordonia sp. CNJ-863]
MDSSLAGVLVAVVGVLGPIFAVVIKKRLPHKKDRVELFFERYDKDRETDRQDIKDLRDRVEEVEKKNVKLQTELTQALKSLDDKDAKIKKLEKRVKAEAEKYARLLKRFNALKAKYEASE